MFTPGAEHMPLTQLQPRGQVAQREPQLVTAEVHALANAQTGAVGSGHTDAALADQSRTTIARGAAALSCRTGWAGGSSTIHTGFLTVQNAIRATSRAILIHQTIAIVVDTVPTYFRCGGSGNATLLHTVYTSWNGHLAGTCTTGDSSQTFIDLTIAVVVHSIAELYCIRMDSCVLVIAITSTTSVTIAIGIKTFIDLTIAVVVYAIADLCFAWIDSCVLVIAIAVTCGETIVVRIRA
jgi:hypothetical protein